MSEQLAKREHDNVPQMEMVQYSDGETALVFTGDGKEIDWYTTNKWVDNPAMPYSNLMIVTTESGNQYGFGRGVVLNARDRVGAGVSQSRDVPPIELGASWQIPVVGQTGEERIMRTTPVESVAVRYKVAPKDYAGARQVDSPSPFVGLDRNLEDWQSQT